MEVNRYLLVYKKYIAIQRRTLMPSVDKSIKGGETAQNLATDKIDGGRRRRKAASKKVTGAFLSSQRPEYRDRPQPGSIDEAYMNWLSDFKASGSTLYFLTFVFNQLPGRHHARLEHMRKRLDDYYSMVVRHAVHRAKQTDRMPILLAVPETRWKAAVKSCNIADTRPNDGWHYHAILILHPLSRSKVFPFHRYSATHRDEFVRGGLRNVHVMPMDERWDRVWNYMMKSYAGNPDAHDGVLLYPKSESERESGGGRRFAGNDDDLFPCFNRH